MVVMRLLIDENVPESVASFFRERGHEVLYVRDILLPSTPDPVVAAAGDRLGAIIVTWDQRDFRRLAARVPEGGQAALRRLGRISFRCPESSGRKRLEQVIGLIEAAYVQAQEQKDSRLLVEITKTNVRFLM
jgi:predicted nuclease of predicted toxin-antitoxin system